MKNLWKKLTGNKPAEPAAETPVTAAEAVAETPVTPPVEPAPVIDTGKQLRTCVENNDLAGVQHLLDSGTVVTRSHIDSAIYLSAPNQRTESTDPIPMLEILCASPTAMTAMNAPDYWKQNAGHVAIWQCDLKTFQWLLEHGLEKTPEVPYILGLTKLSHGIIPQGADVTTLPRTIIHPEIEMGFSGGNVTNRDSHQRIDTTIAWLIENNYPLGNPEQLDLLADLAVEGYEKSYSAWLARKGDIAPSDLKNIARSTVWSNSGAAPSHMGRFVEHVVEHYPIDAAFASAWINDILDETSDAPLTLNRQYVPHRIKQIMGAVEGFTPDETLDRKLATAFPAQHRHGEFVARKPRPAGEMTDLPAPTNS